MDNGTQKVQETSSQTGDTIQKTTRITDQSTDLIYYQDVAQKIIWYIAGVLLVLLGFRFVLALVGANTVNGFANFIYKVSHPFVSPFFSLFSYKQNYGASHFEIYTLVAMLVYAAVAWGIAGLFNLTKGRNV
ncbi:MAG TPA: YggT family protein [Candidatus Saccharimonadales bacterium]